MCYDGDWYVQVLHIHPPWSNLKTKEDMERFKVKTDKLVKQFDNYVAIDDVILNIRVKLLLFF